MNAKKELPRIEAKSATGLLDELEKFDEFLVAAKPKASFETLEYMKASLKGQTWKLWEWERQTDEGLAYLRSVWYVRARSYNMRTPALHHAKNAKRSR